MATPSGNDRAFPNASGNGITVRQLYKMVALHGFIAGRPCTDVEVLAKWAGQISDAMVEEDGRYDRR